MAFDIDHRVHHHWVQYTQQHGFYNDQYILMNSDEPQHLAGEAQQAQTLRAPILPSQQRTRCTLIDTSTISFLVPRLPTGKETQWPTSETTSAEGEHQHHIARLHLHARSTSSTSEDRETSYLHDTYGHRVYNRTWIGSACVKERLYTTSSSTVTSLDHQAWIHKMRTYNQTMKHL